MGKKKSIPAPLVSLAGLSTAALEKADIRITRGMSIEMVLAIHHIRYTIWTRYATKHIEPNKQLSSRRRCNNSSKILERLSARQRAGLPLWGSTPRNRFERVVIHS